MNINIFFKRFIYIVDQYKNKVIVCISEKNLEQLLELFVYKVIFKIGIGFWYTNEVEIVN